MADKVDIALILGLDNIYDIEFDSSGEFITTSGLDTSLNMAFYAEARADSTEQNDPLRRSGWVGNELSDTPNFEVGSKNWLLYQTKKTQDTLNYSETYNYNAFKWLISDGFADTINVNSQFTPDGISIIIALLVNNKIQQSFEFSLWQNTPSNTLGI